MTQTFTAKQFATAIMNIDGISEKENTVVSLLRAVGTTTSTDIGRMMGHDGGRAANAILGKLSKKLAKQLNHTPTETYADWDNGNQRPLWISLITEVPEGCTTWTLRPEFIEAVVGLGPFGLR